ncbi:MAG TPA: PAS domain S-box protein, partial [Thermoanaerobaculia bacterium]|nr:PAS domain S-box protein [Thermoanaerobaculia bacterium]
MPLHLLLVEDDPTQAESLRHQLAGRHPGAEVVIAASLAAALDQLQRQNFAAVLLDLELPDSQGLDTFHAVRQAAPEAALVVITGHDDPAYAAAVAAAGAQDYLVKGSFTGDMLQRSLRAALERERLLRDLREQEARFRGVVESLGEGVVLTDFERITYVNPRMLEMTGFARQDLIGKVLAESPFFIADPDDHEQRLERRRAGMPEVWEMPLRRADYSVMWAQVHGAPVRDAEGQVVGTVAAFSDVTAQRAAERARQEAEARLRQVVAHSPAVLYALAPTPPYPVTWMSESAAGILGFAPDDFRLLPDLWSQRIHPDDVAAMPRTVERLRSGEDSWNAEYRFRHADGRWLWLTDRISVVRGGNGAPIELVGACQDVTSERQLEEMLRQAQKMEAVGRLAGGVAHDFNNLLTAIGGYSELLLMRLPADDPSRHELEEIR